MLFLNPFLAQSSLRSIDGVVSIVKDSTVVKILSLRDLQFSGYTRIDECTQESMNISFHMHMIYVVLCLISMTTFHYEVH